METLFRRHFWVVHVVLTGVAAFMLAGTVNGVIAHELRGLAASLAAKGKTGGKRKDKAANRDFAAASEANIFDGKREVLVESLVPAEGTCLTDADCSDGQKCVAPDGEAGESEDDDDDDRGKKPFTAGPGPGLGAMIPGASGKGRPGKPGSKGAPPVSKVCKVVMAGRFADAVLSEIGATLVGTAVFENPRDSLASILDDSAGRKADADLFSINECDERPELDNDAGPDDPSRLLPTPSPCNELQEHKLVRIEAEKVFIFNTENNQYEYLPLEEPDGKKPKVARAKKAKKKKKKDKGGDDIGAGITKVGPNNYEVTQSEVDGALGNLSKIATQARIVPAFEGGQAVGFKLFSIRPGSLYSKIGVQNGDIIQKVNGYEITSPDKALDLYQKLRDGKEFSVDIKRRGKPVTLEYNITP